jgi:glutamate synthase domain-containing protein 3
MKNPFEEFKDFQKTKRDIPLDQIVKSRNVTMARIMEGYEKLLEEEVKELVWLVQYNTVIKAYANAEKNIKDLKFKPEDIEDFCFELDSSDRIPYMITGPAGIYIAALCNRCEEDEIVLKLDDIKTQINLLGYRLPAGKKLVIEGNVGDFVGIGVEGGEVVIEGSAKNYAGAGMRSGKLMITKNVGHHTGEWMMGGEIHVGGRIRGLGNIMDGKIYERDQLIYPKEGRYSNLNG